MWQEVLPQIAIYNSVSILWGDTRKPSYIKEGQLWLLTHAYKHRKHTTDWKLAGILIQIRKQRSSVTTQCYSQGINLKGRRGPRAGWPGRARGRKTVPWARGSRGGGSIPAPLLEAETCRTPTAGPRPIRWFTCPCSPTRATRRARALLPTARGDEILDWEQDCSAHGLRFSR